MIIAKQLFQQQYYAPRNHLTIPTYKLMENLGFLEFSIAGVPTFLPIGQKIMQNICRIIIQESEKENFNQIYLPLLEKKSLLERSGNLEPYGDQYIRLESPLDSFVLTATSEEPILDMAFRSLNSYRQLPIKLFQIADKFRFVKKVKGIIRCRQFLSADFISLDEDQFSLKESTASFELIAKRIFTKLNLKPQKIMKENGTYDFIISTQDGEQLTLEGKLGSSLAMYHNFNIQKEIQPLFLDKNGSKKPAFIGTYGIGIQRCFHGIICANLDDRGINFPKTVRPFEYSILVIPSDNPSSDMLGLKMYQKLSKNYSVMLDNRHNLNLKAKAAYSDFIGVPNKIIIGPKECHDKFITLKNRDETEIKRLNLELFLK